MYILSFIIGMITGAAGIICIAVEIGKNETEPDEPWEELEKDCNGCFGAAGNDCRKCREEQKEKTQQEKGGV